MAYYLKIVVLSFVWKWKIVIITFFCEFMEELYWQFQQLLYSPVLLNHSQYRWIKMKLSLFLKRRSHCQNTPMTGKE